MGPGACQRDVEMVATGLGGEAAFAAGTWLAVSGQPMTALRLLALEGTVLAAFVPLVTPVPFNQQTHLELQGC
ncbi:hypothetical protein D3C84_241980 [compost metagenome]